MALKVPANKSDKLSIQERERTDYSKLSSDLHVLWQVCASMCACMHSHTFIQINEYNCFERAEYLAQQLRLLAANSLELEAT